MKTTLTKLLLMVAKDKKVKDPKKWVEQKLRHGHVTYNMGFRYINFWSVKSEIFGVQDAEFPASRFVWYTVTDLQEDRKKMYDIEGIQDVMNDDFLDRLAYIHNEEYDNTLDCRLYFEGRRVKMRAFGEVKGKVKELELGDYCPKENIKKVTFNFYSLLLLDFDILTKLDIEYDFDKFYFGEGYYCLYFWERKLLELKLIKDFREFFTKEAGVYGKAALPCYTAPGLKVIYEDKILEPVYVPKPDVEQIEGTGEDIKGFPIIFWREIEKKSE